MSSRDVGLAGTDRLPCDQETKRYRFMVYAVAANKPLRAANNNGTEARHYAHISARYQHRFTAGPDRVL